MNSETRILSIDFWEGIVQYGEHCQLELYAFCYHNEICAFAAREILEIFFNYFWNFAKEKVRNIAKWAFVKTWKSPRAQLISNGYWIVGLEEFEPTHLPKLLVD